MQTMHAQSNQLFFAVVAALIALLGCSDSADLSPDDKSDLVPTVKTIEVFGALQVVMYYLHDAGDGMGPLPYYGVGFVLESSELADDLAAGAELVGWELQSWIPWASDWNVMSRSEYGPSEHLEQLDVQAATDGPLEIPYTPPARCSDTETLCFSWNGNITAGLYAAPVVYGPHSAMLHHLGISLGANRNYWPLDTENLRLRGQIWIRGIFADALD